MLYLSLFLFILLLWVICTPQCVGSFSKEATLPLRGILALLIVLHHLSQRLTYMIPEESVVKYLRDFNSWGAPVVSVFFFMSGYGILKSYQNSGKDYLGNFFSGRLYRIMVPFIICCLVFIPFNNNTISSFFILDTWKRDCPLLPSSWFVIAVLFQYLVFYIAARVFNDIKGTLIFSWVLSTLLMLLLDGLDFKSFWWQTLLSFNVGMSLSYHEKYIRRYLLSKKALFISYCLLLVCFYFNDIIGISVKWSFLLRVVLLPVFIWQLICKSKIHYTSFVGFIGKISYEIYLVHPAILGFLFGFIGGHPILLIITTYILSLMCAYALHCLVRKLS